eukprot:CAMPEP_0174379710 /NCGR_PEP_ID=MMETSP0811_2-20130205/122888_1 /TAXON_ID=73025 ORGANISM="Eutreptiella gymnastica-like, Strain CCMP1594" /NCGR_SAMPLE_ID=MMETSP0811_2 /ASSEMBLY_ACC=CAM_ASM_000667 /LENGTH=93 /DNA_ID=CAMNT_0015532331 /DNA_START=2185 /DNA_END=2466 /DNA_ORIENTATION=-
MWLWRGAGHPFLLRRANSLPHFVPNATSQSLAELSRDRSEEFFSCDLMRKNTGKIPNSTSDGDNTPTLPPTSRLGRAAVHQAPQVQLTLFMIE